MQAEAGRAHQRVLELSRRQYDLAGFWREASAVISTVVPHYWVPCWYTLDPASHLLTSHFHEGLDDYPDEWLRAEYLDDDVNQILDVVRSEPGVSTLHELTGGDPSGTPRWQANIELGGDQELLLRLRTSNGEVWGALGLYREPGSPMFDEHEKRFLVAVSTPLAEGARRALVFGEATAPEWPDGPGLVVISATGEVEQMTEAGRVHLTALAGTDGADPDPTPVLAVARAAFAGEPALARVRIPHGPWLMVSASRLVGEDRVAVLLEVARPARIFDLVMSAHGLTTREREVVELVLQGRPTAGIADALAVSPYTVQEHLKAVFDKMGVRSRRELVAQAFFTHYAPRFRDNERRVETGLPMRGNPAATTS
jgi:DNA-binding CsgD family transcriptional regulator